MDQLQRCEKEREESRITPRIFIQATQKSKLPFTKMGRLKKDQVWERKIQESGFGDVIFDMPISQSLKQRSTLVSMSDNCWQSLLQAEGHEQLALCSSLARSYTYHNCILSHIYHIICYLIYMYHILTRGELMRTQGLGSLMQVYSFLFYTKIQLTQELTLKSVLGVKITL